MNNIDVFEIFSKPVKRDELAEALGVTSNRVARKVLSELQEHYNIINLQDGKGYFLADDETTLKYARQEQHRAIQSFKKANGMIKRCSKNKSGIRIPVKAHFRTIGSERADGQIKIDL